MKEKQVKVLGVHGRRWPNGCIFVVLMVAASCHKSEINRISLEINFYSSGTCPAQVRISDKIFITTVAVTSPVAKKCERAIGMQRTEGKKYLQVAKTNWWKYIHLYSLLYIQYIIYFGKRFIMPLQAYVKDELHEFQQNKMLNLASGETFQLREPLG